MKKGYYIHSQGRETVGISKKINVQMEELRKHLLVEEQEIEVLPRSLLQRIAGLFPTASISRNYDQALANINHPDFLYVRRMAADKKYVQFFRRIKENYPACKIIIEIFTYPYDRDSFLKWNAWPFWIKELIYRNQLKKYIDRYVVVTDVKEDKIFGVPVIVTSNGVNVSEVRKVQGIYKKEQLTMIGVAHMQRQHAYERVLEGMREYYALSKQPVKVFLKLVGDGPEKEKYRTLAAQYGLEKYVRFYPVTTGQALDDLYDEADVALAAFGMYKVKCYGKLSALKTRECLAKGLPMITGCPIDILDEEYEYVLNCPNDASPINMEAVVSFYQRICSKTKEEVAEHIREFAFQHADISCAMKPVVDFIEKDEEK